MMFFHSILNEISHQIFFEYNSKFKIWIGFQFNYFNEIFIKTPLHVAIEDENVLVVKALLARTSINPNATSILNNFFDSYRF